MAEDPNQTENEYNLDSLDRRFDQVESCIRRFYKLDKSPEEIAEIVRIGKDLAQATYDLSRDMYFPLTNPKNIQNILLNEKHPLNSYLKRLNAISNLFDPVDLTGEHRFEDRRS